jgi:hypothetical protein
LNCYLLFIQSNRLSSTAQWPAWIWLAWVPVYFFIVLYVYTPLKIKKKLITSRWVQFSKIEATSLPQDPTQKFYQDAEALAGCGFRAIGHVRREKTAMSQDGVASVWVNNLADTAQIMAILTPRQTAGGGVPKVVTVVTFRTEFTDASAIVTSNAPTAMCFPGDPNVKSLRCRNCEDMALLYRIHRARIDRQRNGRTATLELFNDAASRLEFEHHRLYQRMIDAGYFKLDAANQRFVPTIMGAYLMTYRMLPPIKQLRNAYQDFRAARELRELGFEYSGNTSGC